MSVQGLLHVEEEMVRASAFSTRLGQSARALMPLSVDRHADLFKELKELQLHEAVWGKANSLTV